MGVGNKTKEENMIDEYCKLCRLAKKDNCEKCTRDIKEVKRG